MFADLQDGQRTKTERTALLGAAALVVLCALVLALAAGRTVRDRGPSAEVAQPADVAVENPLDAAPSAPVTELVPVLATAEPVQDRVAAGLAAWQAREYASAAEHFTAEAQARPERAWTHYMAGLALWKAGDTDEAVTALEEAARLEPASVRTWVNLSRVHNDRGEFAAALESARRALGVAPEDASAHFLEARSLTNLGRLDEAEAAVGRSLARDAQNGHAHNLLGLLHLRRGMPGAALAPLEQAARLEPQVAWIQNNLGMALELSGRTAEAIAIYRRAVGLDERHEPSAGNLARLEPAAAAAEGEGAVE